VKPPYRIQQEIQSLLQIFYQRISAANSHQGSFLRISDIASRLEIKETITDEEIRTNYITLPHFEG
jgi:hypothetical protein